MKPYHSRTTLALVIALSLAGSATLALAQQPATPPAHAAAQMEQGTVSQATYPLPDSHGGTLTVRAGMSDHMPQFGPPPSFKSLDTNGDGRIDQAEADAYPPLANDFLFASGQRSTISRAQYAQWVRTQH